MIVRDFQCHHCAHAFEDLVERSASSTPCEVCGREALPIMSAPMVLASGWTPTKAPPLPTTKAKTPPAPKSESKRRDLHQLATRELAADMVKHGKVSEKKAAEMAGVVAARTLARSSTM